MKRIAYILEKKPKGKGLLKLFSNPITYKAFSTKNSDYSIHIQPKPEDKIHLHFSQKSIKKKFEKY